jgi:DnaK suppressor protein
VISCNWIRFLIFVARLAILKRCEAKNFPHEEEMKMNKDELFRLRTKIQTMLENLENTTATARAVVQESSEVIPNFLQDECGAAKGGIDLENAISVHDHCTTQLKPLRNALIRMERGEYGLCQDCGCEIGLRRLEAVPGATSCVQCQEVNEVGIPYPPGLPRIAGAFRNWRVVA